MREFKCQPFYDDIVDLDNPETYKHLPDNIKELRYLMLREIGYALCYMNYWHKDWFSDSRDGGQRIKVEELIKNFTENERSNYSNIMWYKEQVFLFQDQIENMC